MHQINHLNSEQKKWVVINDESWGTCSTNNQIKFKTTLLKSSFFYYSDAYILVKGKILQLQVLLKSKKYYLKIVLH